MAEFSFEEIIDFIKTPKYFQIKNLFFPSHGEKLSLELTTDKAKDIYVMDINRRNKSIKKFTFQNRKKSVVELIRVDYTDSKHMNPDGEVVSGNHIHIYKPKFGLSFAYNFDDPRLFTLIDWFDFSELDNKSPEERFEAFCTLCSCVNFPNLQVPIS